MDRFGEFAMSWMSPGIVAPTVKPKAVITRYTPARKAGPPGAIRLEKGLSSRVGGRSV
jgi:hypothetical protein